MPNRLKDAHSPYLRQHQDNPVDWYPWGPEAFSRARTEDKPVLLSIGYSACHWCHVMAHESFEDAETAALMNRLYVNVKVDREEHPDVDQVYQHALQLFSEHGGWPLTMFLLPSGEPFFGGTYFPPDDRYGRPSFRRVLTALAEAYQRQGDDVREQARRLVSALGQLEARGDGGTPAARLVPDFAVRASAKLSSRMDPRHGGFLGAPKFPSPSSLELQLRGAARSERLEDAEPVLLTLRRMAEGGIYDQLGGGFSRYSTDAEWLVPHFEKMLYDNAQLLRLYAAGLQICRRAGRAYEAALHERVLRETLGWLERELRDPAGGLYAAQDADSEGVEGKYFVFTPAEVAALCSPDEAEVLCRCLDVREGGNWHDPHGHGPGGASILHVVDHPRDEGEARRLESARAKLLAARLRRVPPGTDDKVLTGWNGLAISGLCDAARALGEGGGPFLAAARRTADFLRRSLLTPDGALLRTYQAGVARLPGTLDDHAFLAEGLLLLAEATEDWSYLDWARRLVAQALARFHDPGRDAFYLGEEDADGVPLPVRPTSVFDSAVPSGVSVLCKCMLRLGELLGEEGQTLRDIAERALLARADGALRDVFGLSNLCSAVDLLQHGLTVTVIAHAPGQAEAARRLRHAAGAVYVPDPFTVRADGAAALPPGLRDLAQGKEPRGGPAAYACQGQQCSAPVTDEAALQDLLAAL